MDGNAFPERREWFSEIITVFLKRHAVDLKNHVRLLKKSRASFCEF